MNTSVNIRQIGAASAVMHGHKAKLSIHRSDYAPTLTYGHVLWVMGRLPREDFQTCPTRRRLRGRPRTCWETMSLGWPGRISEYSPKSWGKCRQRRKSGHLCLGCCPCNPVADKAGKGEKWRDCWISVISLFTSPTFMLPITSADLPLNSHHIDSFTSCYFPTLCPDFSEAVSSERLYLPGQTQNQYPQHKHSTQAVQQIWHQLLPCSDYKAEMPEKKSSFSRLKRLFIYLVINNDNNTNGQIINDKNTDFESPWQPFVGHKSQKRAYTRHYMLVSELQMYH